MPSVDQTDLEPAIFQNLEQRNPVHASRFHRDCLYPALLEPIGQQVQVLCKSRKRADVLSHAIRRYSYKNFRRPDINSGGVRPHHR